MRKYFFLTIIFSCLVLSGCLNKKDKTSPNPSLSKRGIEKKVEDPLAQEEIEETAPDVEENEKIEEALPKKNDEETKDWLVYEKKEKNIKLKYHKHWYYQRDSAKEKELGADLYVGFAPSPEILAEGSFYPIEFIVKEPCDCKQPNEIEYSKVILSINNLEYSLRTNNKKEYGDILNTMAETLEVAMGGEELSDNDNPPLEGEGSEDWKVYRNEKYGFEFDYPDYYFETEQEISQMEDKDFHASGFGDTTEDWRKDFKKHAITFFVEGGTHSGTFILKQYDNKHELEKTVDGLLFSKLELKENETGVEYYLYNEFFIIPVDDSYIVIVTWKDEYRIKKFEKEILSIFKFIK